MEEQLIAEIERRSVLYDRSVQACKKMSARDEAWREVADIMKQSEGEVKKRWRTLRDSFMRFHRLQRTFGPKGKKKMWIYYNEMSFLIPHIEPRDYKTSGGFDGCNEYGEDGGDQNSRQEPLLNAAAAADMVSISSDMCEAELTTTPPPLPPHQLQQQQQHHHHHQYPGGDGVGCPCSFNGAVHPEPMVMVQQQQQHHREQAECGGKRKRPDDPAADSDEHFALSCVAALRRLPPRKNAETRVRILHVLYEAEYGEEPSSR